jgi:rubrerythrin
MTLEEAIKMAIDYEIKVRDSYLNNVDKIKDETGQRVFKVLGDEEQGHVDYLEDRLKEWQSTGKVSPTKLETVVPPQDVIDKGIQRLDQHLEERDYGTEREMLRKAIALERETSDFYHKMVDELGEDGELFGRFLEIEDGHLAIVQAELDYLMRTGNYFDFQEFTMDY